MLSEREAHRAGLALRDRQRGSCRRPRAGPRPCRARRARARRCPGGSRPRSRPANAASQPGTSSPHLNSFMSPPPRRRLAQAYRRRCATPRRRPVRLYDRSACAASSRISGEPISLGHVLYETDSSLVRQSYSPRMMETFLNLAGFGMVAWDPRSVRAEDPFAYRATRLPAFDPQPPQPRRQARPDLPDRARPRRHQRRARDGRRDEPAPVPLPRRARRAGAQRAPARVRPHALRPGPAHPAGAGPAHQRDDRLRVDLRARALAARGPVRRPGGARAGRRRGGRAAPAARGPRAPRDRHLVAGQPVPRHGRGARRHALLVRLRLVPGRGRAARDRPAVLQPLVHGRRRVRASATGGRRWPPATRPARC